MKTFEGGGWGSKINFVDKNNVLVGFDYSQCCCEDFGYFYSNDKLTEVEYSEVELDPYFFDETFVEYPDTSSHDESKVMFKLIKRKNDKNPIYLTLYNIHNGYYSHGFEMSKDKTIIHEGSL